MALTSSVVWQMMARFRNFYNLKKLRLSLKRRIAFWTDAKIYFSQKYLLGLYWGTLNVCSIKKKSIQLQNI